MKASLGVRAGLLSLLLLGLILGVWHLATLSSAPYSSAGCEPRCRPTALAQRASACRCAMKAAPMPPRAPSTSAR